MEGPDNLGSTMSVFDWPMVARTGYSLTSSVRSMVSAKTLSSNSALSAAFSGRVIAALASLLIGTSEKRAFLCGGGFNELGDVDDVMVLELYIAEVQAAASDNAVEEDGCHIARRARYIC